MEGKLRKETTRLKQNKKNHREEEINKVLNNRRNKRT
jgi:hypothetical protein